MAVMGKTRGVEKEMGEIWSRVHGVAVAAAACGYAGGRPRRQPLCLHGRYGIRLNRLEEKCGGEL
jgi:hypothetical protein